MLNRKINNSTLWNKIHKLREVIKLTDNFKQRNCWKCGKRLNIYDFMSDNVSFSPEYIFKLWQTPILEFHCCECFRDLKRDELEKIEWELAERKCLSCGRTINIYQFSKIHNYLKIYELKNIWLNPHFKVFCDNLCQRKYYKTYYNLLNQRKRDA